MNSVIQEILTEAEQYPADFHHYRSRAQVIRKLKYSSFQKLLNSTENLTNNETLDAEKNESLAKHILDWLLAQFYERFTPYWPLLFEPIESFANGMRLEAFWDCFERAMDNAWKKAGNNVEEEESNDKDLYYKLPIDYSAYRVQLLRLLTKLPSSVIKAELRTRYLSPKFIQLYREEFMQIDELIMESPSINAENVEEISEEKSLSDTKPEEKKFHRPINFHTRRRGVLNSLKAILTLFGQFKNPLGVYREPEIREIYYELLSVNEPEVQRLALGCLLTYKYSWLTPYRESLEAILDEKTLREQLVIFNVDGQQTTAMGSEKHGRTVGKKASRAIPLLDEHRTNLMSILLRLLYGSLHTHVAHRGKSKRLAIFRFLANCLSEELAIFIRFLFGPFLSIIEFNDTNMVNLEKTLNSFEAEKRNIIESISLNRLKSVFGALNDIFRILGPILDDVHLHLLFNILLLSGRTILLRGQWIKAEERPKSSSTPLERQLKNLRLLCMETLNGFFRTFQTRPSLPIEGICFLFSHFIRPLIESKSKFNNEKEDGKCQIALPNSIYRQFCVWAKIERFHPLLNVPFEFSADSTIFSSLPKMTPFSLLCDQLLIFNKGNGQPKPIHLEILRIFSKMINSDESKNMENSHKGLEFLFPQANIDKDENASFGSQLVLATPNLDKILAHLSLVIRGPNDQKSTPKIGRIPPIYFEMLNRLSSRIHTQQLGSLFANTLLHFITNKNGIALRRQREEKAQKLIDTLAQISTHLDDIFDAIKRIGPLFSRLDGRQLRESLTKLIISFGQNTNFPSSMEDILNILESLESWDSRKIAEPDADRRCEALLRLNDWYEQKGQSRLLLDGAINFLPLFAHSHAHSLMKSNDLSLRSTTSNCFHQLIEFIADPLVSERIDFGRFLHTHLIPLTLRGLKANATGIGEESIRHEFVQCLVKLLRTFPNDQYLEPLKLIGGTVNGGEDDDFFECSIHIQTHKRQRAFHRLADRLNSTNELDQIGHLPLLNFILPIIEPNFMETAPNRSALADQALNLFSAILKRCPWPKYQKLLGHYLQKVDTEELTKPAIRVIIAILDAFHFDLRNFKDRKLAGNFAKMIENKENDQIEMEEDTNLTLNDGNESLKSSQRIYSIVTKKLLPRLRNLLNPQRQLDSHRRAQQFTANNFQFEDEKLRRAPLVIAAIKLFKWLPPHIEKQNLHSFLFVLNHLLMSRSSSVRQGARKLMVQIVKLLGPKQLAFIIRELKQTMNKGFQVHVMIFTVHTLISALEQNMQPGDIDPCLKEIIEVCKWETFGNSQLEDEDKNSSLEGKSDSRGVPEAKGNNKTAETLTQIGRFVGNERILNEIILGRIKEIVDSNPTSKTVGKISEWLRALCLGMRSNAGGIPPLRQLHFSLQMTKTNLEQMIEDQARMNGKQNDEKKVGQKPQNCLLLAPEPKRLGVIQKVAIKSKIHIFVEFALQLLADQLKARTAIGQAKMANEMELELDGNENEEKMEIEMATEMNSNEELKELLSILEQFIPILMEALKQKYDKIIALCLSSLLYLLKYPLKSLECRHSELLQQLFVILTDYAAMGQAGNRPTIIELQQNLFKCFTQLIRNSSATKLNSHQMQLLLNYMETDILDSQKQATAFSLIKAIIGQKIEDEKITDMINYLSETAITSGSTNIRNQCRQAILLYLTIHPNGQRSYEQWMEFFLNQSEYELEDGRMSALEMVHSILGEFTEEANARYALLVHMKLATRLVNDQSEQCRQFVGLCIRKLLNSITPSAFNDVHSATNDWLNAKKNSIRLLAFRTFTQFILSNSPHFTPTLMKFLIQKTFEHFCAEPMTFSELSNTIKIAICELFHGFAEKMPQEFYNELINNNNGKEEPTKKMKKRKINQKENLQKFCNFFVNLMNCISICRRQPQQREALDLSILANKFLIKWICRQQIRENLIEKLKTNGNKMNENGSEMPQKSMLFSLCTILIDQIDCGKIEKNGENANLCWDDELAQTSISLMAQFLPSLDEDDFQFICHRLSKLCWTEAIKELDKARKRLCILKLIGNLASKLTVDSQQFNQLCTLFMPIIYREMGKKSPKFTEELYSLATEVADQFREKMGNRDFSTRLALCQKERAERKQQRKEEIKAQLITNPAAAIALKQKRHERKRAAQQRKLDEMKPHRAFKRRRREEAIKRAASPMEDDDDENIMMMNDDEDN